MKAIGKIIEDFFDWGHENSGNPWFLVFAITGATVLGSSVALVGIVIFCTIHYLGWFAAPLLLLPAPMLAAREVLKFRRQKYIETVADRMRGRRLTHE